MIDPFKNLSSLAVKRPDASDVAELAPTFVLLLVFLLVRNRGGSAAVLLPAFAALLAWLLLKGLRYVPR